SFTAFALVSVRNGALNHLKKEDTRFRHETASSDTLADTGVLTLPGQPDETDIRYLQIITAVNNLPEQRRKVFILSRQHDMTYAGIARTLGISVNTVKMHLRLAYQELRNLLKIWVPLLFFFKIF
ncbi:MAG: sigma-70 family RNA polymerase sigma factor, partial [Bacteroidetes bacterium]|nr:sigma-70 family RNA polymerase sigma factor [Bacteroidota bacterium]